MKQRVKPFTLFLCSIILIFIALGPRIISRGLNSPTPLELMKSSKPKWTGIIRIWHVDYVICGKGTVENWLKDAIVKLEDRYPEVFFEVRRITPDRLAMYFQEGMDRELLPDIVSLNLYENVVPIDMLEDMKRYVTKDDLDILIQPAREAVTVDDKIIGLPYMIGFYTFMLNTDLQEENLLEYEGVEGKRDVDWSFLDQFVADNTREVKERRRTINYFGFVSYSEYYSRPLICIRHPHIDSWLRKGMAPDNIDQMTYGDSWRIFGIEEKGGGILGPTKLIYDMKARQERGEGFEVEVVPVPDGASIGSDQIGFYGILKQDNDYKRGICVDFLKELMDFDMQSSLDSLGMFSIRRDITDIYSGDIHMGILEEQVNTLYKYEK